MSPSLPILREAHPRLYRPVDDAGYRFAPPRDAVRKRILRNILLGCEEFASRRPWRRIPERLDSPHPFHQLYITFYSAMQATALIENYACAWRLTGDDGWLSQAKRWLLAACQWEHSDRIEEHFYTANRYMHAFAFALDLLADRLTVKEEDCVTECLIRLMDRWWPDVDANRQSPAGGHHAVVDSGHFGVAAIHLLGKHSEAHAWVQGVIDRFRGAIMPSGCGRAGEPVDGPTFWPWENLWMLQFGDALRNVVGVDLFAEFPERLARPLKWFRYQLASPGTSIGAGRREVWSTTLLRLAQEAGDRELREIALRDPALGRIYRFGMGVKSSSAECMVAYGPYAYCYYDTGSTTRPQPRLRPSRRFTEARYGESAVLRSSWEPPSLVASVSGYNGGAAHGFSNLEVYWSGHPLLKTISCEEAQPVRCGNLPCVGGQNEIVSRLGRLETSAQFDRQCVQSMRVDQEYWLLRSDPPILLVALRRRKRGARLVDEDGGQFVRLDGRDYLQYPRMPYFDPSEGRLRMRVRLNEDVDPNRPQILFNTGVGLPGLMGTQVNNFSLGQFGGEGLTFAVQSQRYAKVEVRIAPEAAALVPGQWHEVSAAWGGFNDPDGKPFIEVALDGCRRRCSDRARFGELGRDTQHLQSRTAPRTFYIRPNTLLAFGAAIQMPRTGTNCDIAEVELKCPERRPFVLDPADGFGHETGSSPLVWKLHPVDLRRLTPSQASLGVGPRAMQLIPVHPVEARITSEVVPFAPAGLPAASLKHFTPDSNQPSTRILVTAERGDTLVLALAPRNAQAKVVPRPKGFCIETINSRSEFAVNPKRGAILRMREGRR